MTNNVALIAGSTGISGLNLATLLAKQKDWTVYGLARKPLPAGGVKPVAADLLDRQPRKSGLNFYYTQEDILSECARQRKFTWNVHRPNTIIGYAVGNAMNMGTTLAVYASICKETGRPFVFPGSPIQYYGISDMTDARMLAKQIIWAVARPAAANQAFNITNGDVFRWNWMWEQLAHSFGLEAAPYPGQATPLQEQMKEAGPVWDRIVAKYRLKPYSVHELAPWWHTDADLGRTFETFADMFKSRALGFVESRKPGKRLAFVSAESGRPEVYVQAFVSVPAPQLIGLRRQVSKEGAWIVRWRADGRELFYVDTDNWLYAVPVEGPLRFGGPQRLFRIAGTPQYGTASDFQFDVAPDGQRFIMSTTGSAAPPPFIIVENWQDKFGR